MASHAPDGVIKFYQNIKPDMFWVSRSEQNAYYNSHYVSSISDDDYSYVKHTTGAIKVPLTYAQTSDLYNCNYLSFTCSGESKIYYAQIIDFERLNNNTVVVFYGIDWLQTDWDKYRIDYAQIDRESTPLGSYITGDPDTKYTIEPLPYGEGTEPIHYNYISSFPDTMEPGDRGFYNFNTHRFRAVLVAIENEKGLSANTATFGYFDLDSCTTENNSTADTAVGGVMLNINTTAQYNIAALSYNSYPQPFYVIIKDLTSSGLQQINWALQKYAENDMTSSIIGLYYVPDFVYAPRLDGTTVDTSRIGAEFTIPTNVSIADKVNYYPYTYLRATLTDGTQKLYRLDEFNSSDLTFILSGNIGTGVPVASLIPCNYRGSARNFQERLTLPAFPTIPYCIDGDVVYRGQVLTNLLQSNGSKIQSSMLQQEAVSQELQAQLNEFGVIGRFGQNTKGNPGPTWYQANINGDSSLSFMGNLGRGSRAFVSGGRDILDVAVEGQRLQSEIAMSQFGASQDISRARTTGAPISSNSIVNDFIAANAQMQDLYSPASGDITPIVARQNGILFDLVTVRNDLRTSYNKFFNLFGYKSGAVRRPCLSHTGGATSNGDTQALACFKTDPFDSNYKQGYVKCTSINISGVHQESAEWIKAKFLSGTVFHREA